MKKTNMEVAIHHSYYYYSSYSYELLLLLLLLGGGWGYIKATPGLPAISQKNPGASKAQLRGTSHAIRATHGLTIIIFLNFYKFGTLNPKLNPKP